MRPIHMIGLLLYRGGLLLAGTAMFFEAARFVLRFYKLPLQIEVGGAFVIAGFALVILSLILERIRDSRLEGDLRE